ncbi:MAG: hypothetical protein J6S00_05660 [Clostridia bacterium]|nr:hypothetical protein [Clostridia bacterium]
MSETNNRKIKPGKFNNLSLEDMQKLIAVYNQKHNTNYSYGKFVNALHHNLINFEE